MQIEAACSICEKFIELSLWRKSIYVCPDCYENLMAFAKKHNGIKNHKILELYITFYTSKITKDVNSEL